MQRIKAIEAQEEAEDQLRKNYWSNAIDSKEKSNWIDFLHYLAKAGKLTSIRPHTKDILSTINCHMTIFLSQFLKLERFVIGAKFNRDGTNVLIWCLDGTILLWDTRKDVLNGYSLKHNDLVYNAVFNHDETRILTLSNDGTARFQVIETDEDFPKEHLPLMVEVATGTSMDDYGSVNNLSKKKWEELRAEYIRIAEEHLKDCKHKSVNIYLNYQKPNWSKK